MPRKASHVPSYRLHQPSGQARVIIDGQHVWLERYASLSPLVAVRLSCAFSDWFIRRKRSAGLETRVL